MEPPKSYQTTDELGPYHPSRWARGKQMILHFSTLPHNTQPTFGPSNTVPLHTKFSVVGRRPRRACHEKTITLVGAQLPHTLAIIPGVQKCEGGRIFLYKYIYNEETEN
jgi:hypothetical protein